MNEPADLRQIAADDALLDALARGRPVPDGDEFTDVLTAWRRDLDDSPPTDDRAILGAVPLAPRRQSELSTPRRPRRVAFLVAAAAIIGFLAGGVVIGAHRAGPESPLWPITKVLYPEQAEVRSAQQAIAQARTAAAAGRTEEADRLLDNATTLVNRIQDKVVAQRLRDEIEEIRRTLLGGVNLPGVPGGGSPGAPGATPGATPAPTAPGAGPTGGGTPGGGGLPVPSLPLPSIPLPSLPIPPLPPLPSLPILPGG